MDIESKDESKKDHEVFVLPKMTKEYIRVMRGVDLINASYYLNRHKNIKWYRTVVAWLLEICLHNSYHLYKTMIGSGALNKLDYIFNLIEKLQEKYRNSSITHYSYSYKIVR